MPKNNVSILTNALSKEATQNEKEQRKKIDEKISICGKAYSAGAGQCSFHKSGREENNIEAEEHKTKPNRPAAAARVCQARSARASARRAAPN